MKYTDTDIRFEEMPEHQVVETFREDGYTKFEKRSDRGTFLPYDSLWYTEPARMFMAFNPEDKPVGVIGFAPLGKFAMGAGIHTRRPEGRGVGLMPILVNKLLQEKGSAKLFINFASKPAADYYRSVGFNDVDLENLPEDLPEQMKRELLQASKHPKLIEQLQKTMMYSVPQWFDTLKRGN